MPRLRSGSGIAGNTATSRELAKSISEVGLLHPIVVNAENVLVAGERRLQACKSLGWTWVPVTVVDLGKIVRGELAENTQRKDFQPSEIEAIRRAMLPQEKEAATFRKVSGRSAPNGGDTRDKIGAFAGSLRGAPSRRSPPSSLPLKRSRTSMVICSRRWTRLAA